LRSGRYQSLEILGQGGMGQVYRALDRLTGQVVALKKIAGVRSEHDAPTRTEQGRPIEEIETLLESDQQELPGTRLASTTYVHETEHGQLLTIQREAIAREFRRLASLRHPNIISVLDYGFDKGEEPYFTMELLSDARTVLEAARDQPLVVKIDLLIQMLRALSYLHRHGVLHRDIKPSNAMVIQGREGLQVKLLDFGIAASREELRAEEGRLVGTLQYMSPEVLCGEPPAETADLYAVGVVAYQMMTGEHPFGALSDSARLTDAILNEAPDFDRPGIPGPMASVLRKVLDKEPAARPCDASEMIKELALAVGIPLPPEPPAVRESFLQSARFIGREEEIDTLTSALSQALRLQGGGYLIGGESGVGKSRLLDELRTQALIRGMLVLRGQAVSSGAAPYEVFRGVLRPLCLYVPLGELQAGVLKALLPDLPQLLDRPVEDAPRLDAKATSDRLQSVVAELMTRLEQPVVVILEDLHWAGPESIALLKQLIDASRSRPQLWLASYRSDESPELPRLLFNMHSVPLSRLDASSIAALSASMLGSAGRNPKLLAFLNRETEGNALFIVEVLRALTEEAGGLRAASERTLPHHVFSGGIQAVVQRRLGRVPESARMGLQLAAVAGRQIDLSVMRFLQADLDAWLHTCADAAVLEIHEAEWRFAHDKLREHLIAELPAEVRPTLHLKVARALERAYTDRDVQVDALAYHYAEAGDTAAAARYGLRAGELALKKGALEKAAELLRESMALQRQAQAPRIAQLRARRMLLEALSGMGQLEESHRLYLDFMAILGGPPLRNPAEMALSVVRQGIRQGLAVFKLGRKPKVCLDREEMVELAEMARVSSLTFLMLGKYALFLLNSLIVLNEIEQIDADSDSIRRHTVFANTSMGTVLNMIGLDRASRYYLGRAEEGLAATKDDRLQSYMLQTKGLIDLNAGHLTAALEKMQRSTTLARNLGHVTEYLLFYRQVITLHYYLGDYEETLRHLQHFREQARRANNLQQLNWGNALHAAVLLRQGKEAAACVMLRDAAAQLRTAPEANGETLIIGLLSLSLFRLGEFAEAEEMADRLIGCVSGRMMMTHNTLEGYPGPVEVYLELWRRSHEPGARARLAVKLARGFKQLRRYARKFAIGRPRLLLLEGYQAAYSGQTERALSLWRASLQAAQRFRMPLDEALSHQALAKAAFAPAFARAWHQRRAAELFSRLGASL